MNATPDKDDFNLAEFADALRRLDPRDLKLIRLISHRLASGEPLPNLPPDLFA